MHVMEEILAHSKQAAGRCAAVRVLRAGRVLTRLYDDALRPTGLTITQLSLMNFIASFRPESISAIGRLLDIDRTTLSRNLSLLQKDGLVFLGRPGADRKREVLLTTRGLEKLEEAFPKWEAVQARVEAMFEPGEFELLKKALARIREP